MRWIQTVRTTPASAGNGGRSTYDSPRVISEANRAGANGVKARRWKRGRRARAAAPGATTARIRFRGGSRWGW
ncbi:hypothetical protein GCM10022380_84210 [Amycolatopsis tucumanensis]|uniref:Uncharacterized protein n=1 Tax=Amycolatopsis tucumanensis TaxID=401106 RepID=A0ABP7JTK4_9PSEU